MISRNAISRLLINILGGCETQGGNLKYDEATFKFQVKEGFSFTPLLDMQDVATLARIAGGEAWESK